MSIARIQKRSLIFLWLIPLLLLTTWLGARSLNADAIWYDEWWSIYHGGGAHYGPLSPAETWTRVAQEDPRNTPGYYLVLQVWGLFTGWTPFAGRAFSLFIGVLTIAWIYRLGRDLMSPTAGIGAAVVLGTGTFFTYYLHELRAYTLYALLTTVCVWAYWRTAVKVTSWRSQFIFFLSVVSLLYTHYFAMLTVAAIGLYHLLFAPRNSRWWRVVLLLLLAGVTFLPWLKVLSEIVDYFEDTGVTTQFALTTRAAAQTTLFMFSNGSIALFLFFALYSLSAPRRPTMMIWFWAISALGLGLLINAALAVLLHVRYLMALWPALALITGMGIDRLARRRLSRLVLAGIWVVTGLWNTFDPTSMQEIRDTPYYLPWNPLTQTLSDNVQKDDVLLFLLPDQRPLRRSIHEPVAEFYLHDLPLRYDLVESPLVSGEDEYDTEAHEYLDDAKRAWVAYDPTQPPDHIGRLDEILIGSHILCGTLVDSEQLHLNLYTRLPDDEDMALGFGDGITATTLPPSLTNGRLNVPILWDIESDIPAYTYSAAIHLQNEAGELVTQSDYGLPVEASSCHSTDIAVGDLPAGNYSLYLTVYDVATSKRLTPSDAIADENRAALGTVIIGE